MSTRSLKHDIRQRIDARRHQNFQCSLFWVPKQVTCHSQIDLPRWNPPFHSQFRVSHSILFQIRFTSTKHQVPVLTLVCWLGASTGEANPSLSQNSSVKLASSYSLCSYLRYSHCQVFSMVSQLQISYWNKMKKYFQIVFSSCQITAQPCLDFIGHKKFVFLLSNKLNLKSSCVTTSKHSMKWHEIGRKYYRLYTVYFLHTVWSSYRGFHAVSHYNSYKRSWYNHYNCTECHQGKLGQPIMV